MAETALTASPDVELAVRTGSIEKRLDELKLNIVLNAGTELNPLDIPVLGGSLTAVHSADGDGTYISISPNVKVDGKLKAAQLSVNGLAAALHAAGWRGRFWTEVREDEDNIRYRIFRDARWVKRTDRAPRTPGYIVLRAIVDDQPTP